MTTMRKVIRPTTILDGDQARALAGLVRAQLGPRLAAYINERGFDMEEHVQVGTLRARCEEERTKRGLTIKQIAATLKIPQYRLRGVAGGGGWSEVDPAVSRKYVEYLGLGRWARKWATASPKAARRVFGDPSLPAWAPVIAHRRETDGADERRPPQAGIAGRPRPCRGGRR